MLAFVIWTVCGLFFLGLGIYSFKAKKPVGFWANAEIPPMKDLKGYNKAMGKFWCVYSVIFIPLGLPLLAGQNSAVVVISVLGIMFEMIGAMVVYLHIEEKYKKK